ncbi:MAG: phosphomevalonate kinase [Myxococcales bacterium]|nr:phosphomevalonate kinase [Myxococcales bacterium]
MIASAPGKLILTGEYAVLEGAPALVIAVDRRAIARRPDRPHSRPRGTSPFLVAVADEIAARRGAQDPAVAAAMEIAVDSTQFFDGTLKLGLGSSAAVTVAATALAIGSADHDEVFEIASAAHARAQGPRGAKGSGADVAAAVRGGVIAYSTAGIERVVWPERLTLISFFTGTSADTPVLVAKIAAARKADRAPVEAALAAIASASRAACQACALRGRELAAQGLLSALKLAATAIDQLAAASGIPLVPPCVVAARAALARLGGTAKTTGAGGGDVAIGVIPATEDPSTAARLLIEAGCKPLALSVDQTGVDLHPGAQ